ncbi:GNAT family N-acetyltransferase [Fulvivirgaceae bacterium BMA10]|uniref:GNAT family N-acetyltransferase n=1 Tax=Splendidivirga corallicola TaxID=3051826 RepID=A0ABT8KPR1_9BACT|nr:GNAT family N-acetyltransferase [Fulvivirgaceae bacterium BMA10]
MINIRKATQEDIGTLYDLMIAIARHHGQEQYVLTNKEELLKSGFTEPSKFGALIAEFNGKVAGYVSYTWNYSIWLGGDYMNIDDLFVWEEYRGKQIGEKLMQEAKEICEKKNIQRIRWEVEKDNLGAIKFYERLGAEFKTKGIFKWSVA